MDIKPIEHYDNDFATYVSNKETQKKLGQVFTPYSIIERMMNKLDPELWSNPKKTCLDPTMGSGNIVIGMLYRKIVENNQDPLTALSHTYGVELDPVTYNYATERIKKFMLNFTKEKKKIQNIIKKNFVCSDIFKWDLEHWRPKEDPSNTLNEIFA